MNNLLERFFRYVSIETTSDENSDSQPSTSCQLRLLSLLCDELQQMGFQSHLDEYGYVMAKIPANCDEKVPAVGFIAHVDTSPDAPGCNIKPQIVKNYDGKSIVLNEEQQLYLNPNEFPELLNYVGQTIITTDGTTLLGADDKAGVAEIMTFAAFVANTPSYKHGEICIGFTPDEEIGRGVLHFDVKKFGANYAYTFDGGAIGGLEYENFNAAYAEVKIKGRNIHPGYAKNKLVNSQLIAMEFQSLLPQCRPENTEGREGFFHLCSMKGTVEQTELLYIIREHDAELFQQKMQIMRQIAQTLNIKYDNCVELKIVKEYANMREKIEPHFHIVEIAKRAMEHAGVTVRIEPIRGGTDGAMLSFKGLPCPNIFTGGHNFHSKKEFIPLESMEKAVEVMKNIASTNHSISEI